MCRQTSTQSISAFIAHLKHLAQHCQFGTTFHDTLRDLHIVGECSSLQQKQNLPAQAAKQFPVVLVLDFLVGCCSTRLTDDRSAPGWQVMEQAISAAFLSAHSIAIAISLALENVRVHSASRCRRILSCSTPTMSKSLSMPSNVAPNWQCWVFQVSYECRNGLCRGLATCKN